MAKRIISGNLFNEVKVDACQKYGIETMKNNNKIVYLFIKREEVAFETAADCFVDKDGDAHVSSRLIDSGIVDVHGGPHVAILHRKLPVQSVAEYKAPK
jgi:hypothetical protein